MSRVADVAVLGAGVVGMATAYGLARRGLSVVIVDRHNGPAQGTSFANGAQLSYAYTDALASPDLIKKLPSLLLGGSSVFKIRKPLAPSFWSWGLHFLANSTATRFSANTTEGLRLAYESRRALHELLNRHTLAFDHERPGKMHLFYDAEAFAAAQQVMALKRGHGPAQQALSQSEAVAIEPALANVANLAGVVYSPDDEAGDPYRFSVDLLRVLKTEYVVEGRFGCEVSALRFDSGAVRVEVASGEAIQARRAAICLGVDAGRFLKQIGIRAPIWPMKGYSFTAPLGPSAPRVSITDTARKIVFCRLGDQMRVAGLAEVGEWGREIDPARLQDLIQLARESLPEAADYEAAHGAWAGLRPMSPSSLPIISRPRPELLLNIGHGMLGWTYAMGSGERAAALLER